MSYLTPYEIAQIDRANRAADETYWATLPPEQGAEERALDDEYWAMVRRSDEDAATRRAQRQDAATASGVGWVLVLVAAGALLLAALS